MTTTIGGASAPERTIIREILYSLAEKEVEVKKAGFRATFQSASESKTALDRGWPEFVAEEISSLPWYETNLPDGRTPPQPRAAVALISLLAATLDHHTISPSSVNTTWEGGVAVEWHLGGIDLEISCQPDGTAEFSFEDGTGEELEGTVEDDLTLIKQLVEKLPAHRRVTDSDGVDDGPPKSI